MRKKELLKINDELFSKCEALIFKVEELKKEAASLKSEIEILKEEKEELKVKLNTPVQSVVSENESKADFSEETQYGSEVIGRVVIKAAKYCNQLTAKVSGEITKEQINLILGRTEIAKAEILKAISTQGVFEDKKMMAEAAAKSAEDYFLSIMAQTE